MNRNPLPLKLVHHDPHPVPLLLRQPLPVAVERRVDRILRHWRLSPPRRPAD